MIRIVSITIREFRGIRELTLDLGGSSFAVWGPNGSGKSGVVDAIDFALTGDVSRLRGPGSAGVSLAKHGPHVHRRSDPAAAEVVLEVVCSTGARATLTRCVRTPGTFSLSPESPAVRAEIGAAAMHPEITLSRREIIKYVATEAGQRAKEVQALLKLDRLDRLRSTLRTAQNTLRNETTGAAQARNAARDALRRHLDVPALDAENILAAANRRRQKLDLPALESFGATTDLADGVQQSTQRAQDKASVLRDVSALLSDGEQRHQESPPALKELADQLHRLDDDPELMEALRHHEFWATGLGLVTAHSCPLCDTDWPDVMSLRQHIQAKLDRAHTARELRSLVLTQAERVRGQLVGLEELAQTVRRLARDDQHEALSASLDRWLGEIRTAIRQLGSFESTRASSDLRDPERLTPDEELLEELRTFHWAVLDRPDHSERAAAQGFLFVAQDRLRASRQAAITHRRSEKASHVGDVVYDKYVESVEEGLAALYAAVEREFSRYYQRLNGDDESAFKAELTSAGNKLNLTVDFYGLGMFPPTAYHSEGHQDGMGVCLYLALMKHLLGHQFTLAVLDDVVMSVDAEHRRNFCHLLAEDFPNTQFVITTHDQVWARQMTSAGLVNRKNQARFFGWSVDGGPVVEHSEDFWSLIEKDLTADRVPEAAARLRRNLEALTSDLADALGARVVYKPAGGHDFGELLAGVQERHRQLLKKAAKAAETWGRSDDQELVKTMNDRRAAITTELGEGWAVNPAVHYNAWANLTAADFRPVVAAFHTFVSQFQCPNDECGSGLYVQPSKQSAEILRCSCSSVSLNLVPKDVQTSN